MKEQSYSGLEDLGLEEQRVQDCSSSCPALTVTRKWISEQSVLTFHLKRYIEKNIYLNINFLISTTMILFKKTFI